MIFRLVWPFIEVSLINSFTPSICQILSDICQGLELPNTFTIEQKASFCLGFHSKEKEKWDRIREAKERKENE